MGILGDKTVGVIYDNKGKLYRLKQYNNNAFNSHFSESNFYNNGYYLTKHGRKLSIIQACSIQYNLSIMDKTLEECFFEKYLWDDTRLNLEYFIYNNELTEDIIKKLIIKLKNFKDDKSLSVLLRTQDVLADKSLIDMLTDEEKLLTFSKSIIKGNQKIDSYREEFLDMSINILYEYFGNEIISKANWINSRWEPLLRNASINFLNDNDKDLIIDCVKKRYEEDVRALYKDFADVQFNLHRHDMDYESGSKSEKLRYEREMITFLEKEEKLLNKIKKIEKKINEIENYFKRNTEA